MILISEIDILRQTSLVNKQQERAKQTTRKISKETRRVKKKLLLFGEINMNICLINASAIEIQIFWCLYLDQTCWKLTSVD